MEYRGYDNFTDLCGDFLFELNHTLYFSDYRVDGQNCALKFGIMNKLKLFISWMSTRMREATSELYAEHLLALTHEQFNDFRQEDMIRMSSVPTASPPGPTTPMTPLTNQPSRSKQRLTRMHIPWGEFPEQPNTKKLTIEHNRKVKLVNAQKHSTFGNPKPKPSSVVGKSNPQPQQIHFHDNYPSPDNPPQAVDKSCHLSDSTSTTDSLDESSTLNAPDDHLLQFSFSSQLQDTSSVEIEFVSESEGHLDHANLSQTDLFLEHYDYELFLLN